MAINHKAAKDFAKRWSGKTWSEDQYARTFWMDLLKSVYDIEYNDTNNVIFEYRTSVSGKIDLWLRNLSTMVEMKSSGIDLDKPEPRQGELKTPFKQVYDYAVSFPRNEQPDYLVTCNFEMFRVYSRKEHGDLNLESNGIEFTLEELGNKPEYLSFLVDPKNSRLYHEREISETAGQLIGKLYDMLREQYINPDSEEAQHSLNVLCVRLVFCLFCEDAGLFGEMDAFYNYLKDVPSMNIRSNLQRLFKALDTPKDKRDPYDIPLKVFPYVNGGLFSKDVEIPNFTDEIKDFLLTELSHNVDWSKISPTIFGGIFESTLNPETRRQGGMHYTSPENIHKVIDPLFLDDLKAEFNTIRNNDDLSVIQKRNRYKKFHQKLCSLVFFDPACGSGNFLTETYLCLRQLEYAVLNEYRSKQISAFDSSIEGEIELRVKLDQFYGIEINDFAVSVAETALWISRLKANKEYLLLLDLDEKDFPLEERANVIKENALTFDWNNLVEPSAVSFIMGNPPFVGAKNCSSAQKNEIVGLFGKIKLSNSLDYVTGWYYKACMMMSLNSNICSALVSTNSITQGEQVSPLWGTLQNRFDVHIDFAYRTFIWNNEATDQAHVHCVIIGFSLPDSVKPRYIINSDGDIQTAQQISPYLIDAPSVLISSRSSALCPQIPIICKGNMPIDNGNFIFTEDEMQSVIKDTPNLERYFHQYIGAKDYLNGGDKRYCIWLEGVPFQEYSQNTEIVRRVEAVREFRKKSTSVPTQKAADIPELFYFRSYKGKPTLVIPEVSSERRKYIPIGFLRGNEIASNKLLTVVDADLYHFGVLISLVHMSWTRVVTGRLKSDYQYSSSVVYNNFPWPELTESNKKNIEHTAQMILDARDEYTGKPLAKLYDPKLMPASLKAAHEANDRAVMNAYGFSNDMSEPEIVAELMKLYLELTTA